MFVDLILNLLATPASPPPPPFGVEAVKHRDIVHGPHFFKGDDQYTYGNNELCERGGADPWTACPAACEVPAVQQGRVRKALHTLSYNEWQRVVDALWVLTRVNTTEGVKTYGPTYRDYTFHAIFHAASAFANNLTDPGDESKSTDVTGGGPQQPTWHALQTMMFENSLLAVDPSIGALPYLDWRAMDAAAYDRYFGTANGTMLGDFDPSTIVSNRNPSTSVVTHGPFAYWPVPDFDWRTWYDSQIAEVQEFFAEADAYWDNPALWKSAGMYKTFPENTTLQSLLAFTNGQMRHNNNQKLPYLLRGHKGDDFFDVVSSLDWDTLFAYCASDALGWHNEFAACIEGRLVTQRDMAVPEALKTIDDAPDIHLTVHIAAGGTPPEFGDLTDPVASAYDPIFWFHHAGVDHLRRTWQHNNEKLRPWAYGYPAKSGYPYARTDLYDCLGCQAYKLGFDTEHLNELGRWRGTASAADVLCGELDTLYTFDTLAAAQADQPRGEPTAAAFCFVLLILAITCIARFGSRRLRPRWAALVTRVHHTTAVQLSEDKHNEAAPRVIRVAP